MKEGRKNHHENLYALASDERVSWEQKKEQTAFD
jgi:hypothetical protein